MPRSFRRLAMVLTALFLASCTSLPSGAVFTRHQLTLKILTTKDYQEYEWTERSVDFTIDLPADWKVTYSTILDARGRKAAEFSPGFVEGPAEIFGTLAEKGRVFSGPDSESRVLIKERLSFGGRRVVKLSETAVTTGGPEAPDRIFVDVYYVELPKLVFVMAFQYTAPKPEDSTVRRILESVRPSKARSSKS